MGGLTDYVRSDRLERAAQVAARVGGPAPAGSDAGPLAGDPAARIAFLRSYYRHASDEILAQRQPEDLAGAAATHLVLAATRAPGELRIAASTPRVGHDGWRSGGSVVQVVCDDMPFLVDSVTVAFHHLDRPLAVLIHPILEVARDADGRLLAVGRHRAAEVAATVPGARTVRESWMHIELAAEPDPDALARVVEAIRGGLEDTRAAVGDFDAMRREIAGAADALATPLDVPVDLQPLGIAAPDPAPADPTTATVIDELPAFLRWLVEDHFTFIGVREYRPRDGVLDPVPTVALGVLAGTGPAVDALDTIPDTGQAARLLDMQVTIPLVMTKSTRRSRVHRPGYLDLIVVTATDADGRMTRQWRILGLFAASAYNESLTHIPLVCAKAARVVESSGYGPGSHGAKDVLQVLETYPRDEMFAATEDHLAEVAVTMANVTDHRQVRLFLRHDVFGRYLSCLVFLARDRYSTVVRRRLQALLGRVTGGVAEEFTVQVGDTMMARLHVVVRMPDGAELPEIDQAGLQLEITRAVADWHDEFTGALCELLGEAAGTAVAARHQRAFSDAYREGVAPRVAAIDVTRLAALADGDVAATLYHLPGAPGPDHRCKIYSAGRAVSLSAILPVLHGLGADVTDERPYAVTPADGGESWIYDFGVRLPAGAALGDDAAVARFEAAYVAAHRGEVDNDLLNALVTVTDLDHRQIAVLRAYARFLRQASSRFSLGYMEQALVQYPAIARGLVDCFEARFDPSAFPDRAARAAAVEGARQRVLDRLDGVASLDHDRILRSLLTVVGATLRTNFYRRDDAGAPRPYLALKLRSTQIPELPAPRPHAEIWVCAPDTEGVHLRGGAVSRGGVRWSDRMEDFRSEILGLVKAQAVKNSVIVPVGAKGGFVVRRRVDPAGGRQAQLDAAIACYRTFIRGLLDLTDNLGPADPTTGERPVVPPPDVVRWDGDDPYLVVAADKGTASFSDYANAIAGEYGFWLGDAFASGGSAGYDHKAMGITARGAWESVKRHFSALGIDVQQQDVTCVGIGDMSGDVFGNGMLLSQHIRLVAAFDHRHVFIDPTPDAASGYAERRRLFGLPRSSWADYDPALISPGGGVYPRTAKSVPISPQAAAALGLPADTRTLTPDQLVQAVLRAPVDLLWNGGIGTYVKASDELHADAHDKGNDAVRVDAADLRCRIVGEGGNLGLTQRARIEFAQRGGRINTDAVDNSAGVDTSDHEVNIKILLDTVVARGDLTTRQRNRLLVDMTDEVARLVLRHNIDQNRAMDEALAKAGETVLEHAEYLDALVAAGILDRDLEFLPTTAELQARAARGVGLTGPELAVVIAYAKNSLVHELLATDLPDDAALGGDLAAYFPAPIRSGYAGDIARHPLRRELVATEMVNRLVNACGPTFAHRLRAETGADLAHVVRAFVVAERVLGTADLRARIDAAQQSARPSAVLGMRLSLQTVTKRVARWFALNRRAPLDLATETAAFGPPTAAIIASLPDLMTGQVARDVARRIRRWTDGGAAPDLAARVAHTRAAEGVAGTVDTALRSGVDAVEVAQVHFAVADALGLPDLRRRIAALPRATRWEVMAQAALRDDLRWTHDRLVDDVIAVSAGTGGGAGERIAAWRAQDATTVARTIALVQECVADRSDAGGTDAARLTVGLRGVRLLLRGSALQR